MDKVSKKVVIIIVLSVVTILFFLKFFFKGEVFFDVSDSISILNSSENNNLLDQNFIADNEVNSIKIVVYVTGAVNCEGVYELEENSRVSDCIKLAGGVTPEADLSGINLARLVEDGVMICIPKKGESDSVEVLNDEWISLGSDSFYSANNSEVGTSSSSSSNNNGVNSKSDNHNSKSNGSSNINKKVNINTASQKELECLPGVGSATALKIVEYRKQKGRFKCVEDIKKVKGIGESKFAKIKSLIVV